MVDLALLMAFGSPALCPGVAPPAATNLNAPINIMMTAPIPDAKARILAAVLIIFLGPVTRLLVSLPSEEACWQVGLPWACWFWLLQASPNKSNAAAGEAINKTAIAAGKNVIIACLSLFIIRPVLKR